MIGYVDEKTACETGAWNIRGLYVEYTVKRGIYTWIIRGIYGGAPGRPGMAGCEARDGYFHCEIDGGAWNIRWILQWNLLDPAMDSDYWIHQTT